MKRERGAARDRLREIMADPIRYMRAFIWIRGKDKKLRRLDPNEPQLRLYERIREEEQAGKPVRIVILKARQMGFSTFTEALFFARSVRRRNTHTLIVAHRSDATRNLLRMNNLFYNKLPAAIKPMRAASNASEIIFANPSRDAEEKAKNPGLESYIRCMTAGDGIGRSDTTDNLHASEMAFWAGDPEDILLGLMQAMPNLPGTCAIVESTANGYNYFQRFWKAAERGENGFVPVFFPWYELREYQMDVEPGTEWTAEERELQETYGLTERQLAWRRWCIRTNCGGNVDKFRQEYPSNPDEAFLLSGRPFFDNALLFRVLERLAPPAAEGIFDYQYDGINITKIRWTPQKGGPIAIYEWPGEHKCTLGGDTAGDGSDYFAAKVIDNRSKATLARYHWRDSEELFARQMYCLGQFYNGAKIAIECNFSSYPQRELERLGYTNFYVREKVDTYTGETAKAFGFLTTARTRPVILAGLHSQMSATGAPETERDADTLREMLTFCYDDSGKAQAAEGEHDDLVMASAIALFASDQALAEERPPQERGTAKWSADQWEDWRNADETTRRRLLKEWGRPEGL